jgi:hypothetical protein
MVDEVSGPRRLGLGAVGQLLGVPRLTVWWWWKESGLHPSGVQGAQPWWYEVDVYAWALTQQRRILAGRVPVTAWPAARQPARYLDPVDLDGAIGQRWATGSGTVTLVWPLAGGRRRGLDHWARQIEGGGHRAVVAISTGFGRGPDLQAILPGLPDRPVYRPRWAQLAQVLGQPVPYWPPALREARLIRQWRPGTATVTAMAVPNLDTSTLLQTAAGYPEGHPANRVLVNLARLAHQQAAESTASDLHLLARMKPADQPETVLTVAARPLPIPETDLDDVDQVQRRAGWLELLARTDIAAARCVSEVASWDGGADLPFGHPERLDPDATRWATEWASRLQNVERSAAFELLDDDREGETLIDPETDAPVIREPNGTLSMAVPQRLPAQTPLAEVILSGPIWIRTTDGTLYPAPRDPEHGISWGYENGSGPGTLALLVDALLDDVTAKAPADIDGAPTGLEKLFSRRLSTGTVLTRAHLEAARRGVPPILPVPDDDTAEDDDEGDDES